MSVDVRAQMCIGRPEADSGYISQFLSTLILRQDPSPGPELLEPASLLLGPLFLWLLGAGITGGPQHLPGFHMSFRGIRTSVFMLT